MLTVRKIIAILVIIFLALPLIFGIITGVGLIKGVLSERFLVEVPQEVVGMVPSSIDELYVELKKIDLNMLNMRENQRIWLKAILDTDVSPKILFEKSGLNKWIEGEFKTTFEKLREILRNERNYSDVMLNTRGLKESLVNDEFVKYVRKVIEKLPVCRDNDFKEWNDSNFNINSIYSLPSCRPENINISDENIKFFLSRLADDIPNNVKLLVKEDVLPFNNKIFQLVSSLSYLLFILPLIFVLIAAGLGATSKRGFFIWTGSIISIGGVLTLGFSKFVLNLSSILDFGNKISLELTDIPENISNLLVRKTEVLSESIIHSLFKSVSSISLTIVIIGLVIISLGFLFSKKK